MKLKTKIFIFLMLIDFLFTGLACKMPWDSNDDSTPRESSNPIIDTTYSQDTTNFFDTTRDTTNPNDTTKIKIKEIKYFENNGTVSPNYYYTETYKISLSGLTFERTGLSTTTVNVGNWMVNYGAKEEKLFNDLSNQDVYNLKEIGREFDERIGGGTQSYTIEYENGEVREVVTGCSIYKIKYNNSNSVTVPIDDYITSDILPPWASNRYK